MTTSDAKRPMPDGTLLLVDDRADVRAVAGELLESLGYGVEAVDGGVSAEAAFAATPARFAALVTDLDMPGVDGLELAARLRTIRPGLPVMVVSSREDDPRVAAGMAAGELTFLRKPYGVGELEKALGRLGRETGRPDPSLPPITAPEPLITFGRDTPRRRRATGRAGLAVWAGALMAAGLVSVVLLRPEPPALPARPVGGVARGAVIALEHPVGLVDALPTRFSWEPVPTGTIYRLTLQAVDDVVLWDATTGDSSIVVTAAVADELRRGVAYFWRVEALDATGSILASSPRVRFQSRLNDPAHQGGSS